VEMIELDMVMEEDLIAKTRDLATKYFGDDSDTSLAQVLEIAFMMRCLWSRSVKQGQQEIGEAVSSWEFSESTIKQENSNSIQDWLFRR
jgi:hypothetical protein